MADVLHIDPDHIRRRLKSLTGDQGPSKLVVSRVEYGSDFKRVADALATNKTVKNVVFRGCDFYPFNYQFVVSILKSNKIVQEITICKCSLSHCIPPVTRELGANKSVRILRINNCRINITDASRLAEMLGINRDLQCLDLRGSFVEPDGRNLIANALKLNTGCCGVFN
jgi:hypothetical protein